MPKGEMKKTGSEPLQLALTGGQLAGMVVGGVAGAAHKRHLKKTKERYNEKEHNPVVHGSLRAGRSGAVLGGAALLNLAPHLLVGKAGRDGVADKLKSVGHKSRKWIVPATTAVGALHGGVTGYRRAKEDAARIKERGRRHGSPPPHAPSSAVYGALSGAAKGAIAGTAIQGYRVGRGFHQSSKMHATRAHTAPPVSTFKMPRGMFNNEHIPAWAKGAKTKAEAKARFSALVRDVHSDTAGAKADTKKFQKLHEEWKAYQNTRRFEKLSGALVHVRGAGSSTSGAGARAAHAAGSKFEAVKEKLRDVGTAAWKIGRKRRLKYYASNPAVQGGVGGAAAGSLGFLPLHDIEHGKLSPKEKKKYQRERGLKGMAYGALVGGLGGAGMHHLRRGESLMVGEGVRSAKKTVRGLRASGDHARAALYETDIAVKLGPRFEKARQGQKEFFGKSKMRRKIESIMSQRKGKKKGPIVEREVSGTVYPTAKEKAAQAFFDELTQILAAA